jgi:uroporphyrinogen-III decarboxylase
MITDIIIHSILHNPMVCNAVTVGFPLHKGADGWMSPKQYEKFYWPSLKRVMHAFINEGLICQMFAEGGYNTRLEVVKDDFPKGSVVWWFDQSDMALAKKVLGDKYAIQGNVPSSLMVTGSPADVKACCRKLIETCGEGGGYIMAAGCIAENPKLENLRAMMEAVREYGVYR